MTGDGAPIAAAAAGDAGELQRRAEYFQTLADQNGARLLVAESNASRNRLELDQRMRGFALLARLSSDVAAVETPARMAATLTGHVVSILNMSRAAVLMREPGLAGQFTVLAATGFAPDEGTPPPPMALPESLVAGREPVATFEDPAPGAREAFAGFGLPFFLAVPVIAGGEVNAVIVTGRMREQRPFSLPLNAADLETVRSIAGFFGAYLLRYQALARERERDQNRLTEVERLVAERTLELERQKAMLEDSLRRLHATQEQLVLREKMASLGELTAGIAHEIKNPLNFVNNFSELCRELSGEIQELLGGAIQGEEAGELFGLLDSNLGKIAEHGKRADSIVRNMLQHSRDERGGEQPCDLNALVGESIDFAYHAMRAQDPGFDVAVERELDPALPPVTLVPQEISRVVINLLSNAFYATRKRRAEGAGEYRPTVRVSSLALPGLVEVRVRDNGTGMPASVRAKVFAPFFTTKPTGEGTGLGLSISYDIVVKGHRGQLGVQSEPGAFTEFLIQLPIG